MPANSPGTSAAGSELTASDELAWTLELAAELGSELGADVSPRLDTSCSVDEVVLEVPEEEVLLVCDEVASTDELGAAVVVGLDVEEGAGGTVPGGGATLPVVETVVDVLLAGGSVSPHAVNAATKRGIETVRQLARDADMIPRTGRFSNSSWAIRVAMHDSSR